MTLQDTDSALPGPASPLSSLFTPFDLGPLRLPNRFVMAPMTREFSPDGTVTDDVAGYYERRAAAGVGLLITEGVYVSEDSGPSTRVPRLFGEAQLAAWRGLVARVHEAGGRIVPQLWHLGAARGDHAEFNPELPSLSPSGIAPNGRTRGRAATLEELARIRDDFARAAAAAKEAGFDGVELHGAHGYLLDQFLWAGTNRRDDQYGGSLEARLRFPAEVAAAVRAAVGPDFPVIFRFSQWKSGDYGARIAESPEELGVILRTLAAAGVSAFHPSTRRHWEPAFPDVAEPADARLGLAGWTRRLSGLPVITVGSVGLDNEFEVTWQEGGRSEVRGLETLLEQFARGEFDLVAVGRVLLSDPAWVAKVRDGRTAEIRPFSAEDRLSLS
ncbi:putative oxidoreductase [Sinomonas cellulolyticus]|uniref:NADH:flavin oxidoreductase n=1 Tax=Sinomonas cellulolyticus TaxID=2801916 RepID=A0ABS1JZ98_9MICC|nr:MULTISPECIES: NADH:flavin oxidoreductase [Sinomonas]MBL0704533.1 NADH:flavin oxidoreductase [Sinomonas cellulolyticus]GHG49220.1 putative oxidoreductase [Sinomonas sp. KCTC 49339]